MIQKGTNLKVIDNSGAKLIYCINTLKKNAFSYGKVGDIIIISIKKIRSRHQTNIKRGMIFKSLIVQTKKITRRFNSLNIKFDQNSGIILNEKNEPLGSRILSPITYEIR